MEVRQECLISDVGEEWKWSGVPGWSHAGIICTGETYKDKVKLTFAEGASLKDPPGLFNSSLEGNVRRAVDFYEGNKIDEKALIGAAVAAARRQLERLLVPNPRGSGSRGTRFHSGCEHHINAEAIVAAKLAPAIFLHSPKNGLKHRSEQKSITNIEAIYTKRSCRIVKSVG